MCKAIQTGPHTHVQRLTPSPFLPGPHGLQAMGIYLYGELMVSEDARLQQLAHRCFELVKGHMDKASAQVVTEMLF